MEQETGTQQKTSMRQTVKEIKIEDVDDEDGEMKDDDIEIEEEVKFDNENSTQKLNLNANLEMSNLLSKIQNKVEPHWQEEQDEELKLKYNKMNGISRFCSLIFISDSNLKKLCKDIDTFVYFILLRNMIYLVFLLAVLNCGVLIPLYYTGETEDLCTNVEGLNSTTIYLSQIQQLSLGNGINQNNRLYPSLALSIVNATIVLIFALRMKKKIDLTAKSAKPEQDDIQEKEFYLQNHTIIFQTLPRKLKIHDASQVLNKYFQKVYQDQLVSVNVIPDMRSLEYLLMKKKEYKYKIINYEKKQQATNTKFIVNVNGEKIDAVDHFGKQAAAIDLDIEKAKAKEYRIIGTVFVTLAHQTNASQGIKQFRAVVKRAEKETASKMRLNDWSYEMAPKATDIDWKNLNYDKFHRMSRKLVIALFLIIFGFLLVFPFQFLLQYLPMYASKDNRVQNASEDQAGVAFVAVYFLPMVLYCINFLLLPFLIVKLIFYENNHRYTSREFSIMNKMYIYMVFNSIYMPGLQLTISLRFVQLLAIPRLAQPAPFFLQQDNTENCEEYITFNIFYSIDFFMLYLLQVMFMTFAIQIFAILPDRYHRLVHSYIRPSEDIKKRTHAYSGKIPFQEWFYSFDYQVPFVTSIFTICLTFSSSLPLILVVGLIFFLIKLPVDFNQRILLGKSYFSADWKHSNNTVRSSVIKYLLVSLVLYMLVNSLIYSASPQGLKICYISIGFTLLAFCICIGFWLKWKLAQNPRVGNNFDEEKLLAAQEKFDLKELSKMYRHPLETVYPSPHRKSSKKAGSKRQSKDADSQKLSKALQDESENKEKAKLDVIEEASHEMTKDINVSDKNENEQ